jgi:hypothetical protein
LKSAPGIMNIEHTSLNCHLDRAKRVERPLYFVRAAPLPAGTVGFG